MSVKYESIGGVALQAMGALFGHYVSGRLRCKNCLIIIAQAVNIFRPPIM